MGLNVRILPDVLEKLPDLEVLVVEVRGVAVAKIDPKLEEFKEEVTCEVRRRFTLDGLKDEPTSRAYRDFFWKIRVDPTKTRPAAEALIRRVLGGRPMPRINTAVDAYNLASMKTRIALAAFDVDRLNGNVIMRFANTGEDFLGIGMDKPAILAGGEIVMADESRLIAIYPHRDADYSRITLQTKNLMLVSCGALGISSDQLKEAADKASSFIVRFCGGKRDKAQAGSAQ